MDVWNSKIIEKEDQPGNKLFMEILMWHINECETKKKTSAKIKNNNRNCNFWKTSMHCLILVK